MKKLVVDREKSAQIQIYKWLKDEIISAKILPGTVLDKNQLIEKLETSLTPLREAFLLLKRDGFVDLIPNLHTIVRLINLEEIREHVFIRGALECAVVEQLAEQGIRNQVRDSCRNLISQQRSAFEQGDFKTFFKLDEKFHRVLCDTMNYQMLWQDIERHRSHISRACQCCPISDANIEASIAQHEELLENIHVHNVRGARELMREHVHMIFGDLKRIDPQYLQVN